MFHRDKTGNIIAEVIDDYLPQDVADQLEEHFLSRNPQWRFQSKVAVEQLHNRSTGDPSDCFGHLLFGGAQKELLLLNLNM